jgi:hypothetical protein
VIEMTYEISDLVYKKLREIQDIAGSDYGEWENSSEEQLIEAIGNICISLGDMISMMRKKEEKVKELGE